jgi:riboflavin kinase
MARMTGVIFSDLGLASSFMSLEWVQLALKQSLGFSPFPATLNVRPKGGEDEAAWRRLQSESAGLALAPSEAGMCSARLYPVEVCGKAAASEEKIAGAILVPQVKDYPVDKIEIVAPVRLKDYFGVRDGDAITLEFVN